MFNLRETLEDNMNFHVFLLFTVLIIENLKENNLIPFFDRIISIIWRIY